MNGADLSWNFEFRVPTVVPQTMNLTAGTCSIFLKQNTGIHLVPHMLLPWHPPKDNLIPDGNAGQQNKIPTLHEKVSLRAYQLFEDRGRIDGQDLDHWLRAEQAVMSERIDTDLG
jgi:hypothetical protein